MFWNMVGGRWVAGWMLWGLFVVDGEGIGLLRREMFEILMFFGRGVADPAAPSGGGGGWLKKPGSVRQSIAKAMRFPCLPAPSRSTRSTQKKGVLDRRRLFAHGLARRCCRPTEPNKKAKKGRRPPPSKKVRSLPSFPPPLSHPIDTHGPPQASPGCVGMGIGWRSVGRAVHGMGLEGA